MLIGQQFKALSMGLKSFVIRGMGNLQNYFRNCRNIVYKCINIFYNNQNISATAAKPFNSAKISLLPANKKLQTFPGQLPGQKLFLHISKLFLYLQKYIMHVFSFRYSCKNKFCSHPLPDTIVKTILLPVKMFFTIIPGLPQLQKIF